MTLCCVMFGFWKPVLSVFVTSVKETPCVALFLTVTVAPPESVSTISADPNEGHYNTKLSIPGYSSADVLIIPVSKLENLDASYFAIDLKDELITSFYSGYSFYKQAEVNYGIKINKETVEPYMSLPNEDCYMFLNGNSYNIGEYANKPVKEHDLALHLVKQWGM